MIVIMTVRIAGFPELTRENYQAEGLSFGAFLGGLWAVACGALEVPYSQTLRSTRMVRSLLPAWSEEPIGLAPVQRSYVADDGFPAELSVNWSGRRPELRMLFDSLGHRVFPDEPADALATLFTPETGRSSPAPVWHAIAWRPPARVVHKTYFGLYEWPEAERLAAVGEAMARLDLTAAWDDARTRVEAFDGRREVEFFAVDLLDGRDARVKIYYRNHDADLAEVARVAAVARNHNAAAATAAYRALTGERAAAGQAALTCLAFRSGVASAVESTTYLRLSTLTATDQEAVDRTSALLSSEGVDPGRFRALSAAVAPRSLAHSTGVLELVSFRAAGRPGDVTTYFRFPVFDLS
ncbi:hypothetical protein Acsp02_38940 [Actinoplanes sp. NBRC 103695]|nr:hypothetical protein Acsp02_38940 [Actinoplanes sp. NBRC 103695]